MTVAFSPSGAIHKQSVYLSVTFCVKKFLMDCTMDRTPFRVNWDLCVLCQGENKNDKLVSSVNCTRRDS